MGLPVPQSRADKRFDDSIAKLQDRLEPSKPSLRDAQFDEGELEAFLIAMTMVVQAEPEPEQSEVKQAAEMIARTLVGSAEGFENVFDQLSIIPLTLEIEVTNRLSAFREAKKVFVGQQLLRLVWGKDSENEATSRAFDLMGVMGVAPWEGEHVHLLKDVDRIMQADQFPELRLDFRPTWPFMPCATAPLMLHGGKQVPVVNESGQMVFWLQDRQSDRLLTARLNYQKQFEVRIISADGSKEWGVHYQDELPTSKQWMELLLGHALHAPSRPSLESSPLSWLVGFPFEVRSRNVQERRLSDQELVCELSFDSDAAMATPQKTGVWSSLFKSSAKASAATNRGSIYCSLNYHVHAALFRDIFDDTIA